MIVFIYVTFVFAAMSLYRVVFGPTFYDRLLALNLLSAHIILLMCFYAVHLEKSFFLDVAVIYTLLAFTEMVAFVRFYHPGQGTE